MHSIHKTNAKSAVIPQGVTVIGDGLFNGCKALTSVTLHDNITSIGDEAFLESGLSGSFTLPAALENIGSGAFAKTKITEFVVPAGGKIVKEGECVYNADKTVLLAYPPIGQNTTKSFKSPSGIFSDEIVLHYTRKTGGIVSVGSADDDAITIDASAGTITIDADTAEIYTISGAKVASVNGAASISLPAGAYIVAAKKGAAFKNAKVIL